MSPDLKDAFLCHNKADKVWVRRLGERLEAETIDGLTTSRRLSVFFDEWDVDYGENAVNRMSAGLSAARYVVVVMSPEFFKSGWTNFEWTDVVAEDPWGTKKKLIPILLRDTSKDGSERIVLPAPFKALKYFDFRPGRSFEEKFDGLLRRIRGLPPPRGASRTSSATLGTAPIIVEEGGDSWLPDRVRDVLLSNLLQVTSFPSNIWNAPTEKRTSVDVRAEAPEAEAHIIRSSRLWTFADLSQEACKLRKVIDTNSIKVVSSRDWVIDQEKIFWWMALINKALTTHLSKLAIRREEKGRFFFRPNRDGTDRIWKNGNDRARAVAAKKTNPLDGSVFWVHHAARVRFRRLGDRFFLMIEPTYLFTSDGENPLGGQEMGKMVIMWGGKQRNPDILRNFVFWAKTIAHNKPQIEIETAGQPILVSAIPALSATNDGIASDHIRIGSLMSTVDTELDLVAQDVEVIQSDELEEETDESEEE